MILNPRTNNTTHTSCFNRKIKSPYVQQYLTFEERVNSHQVGKSYAYKHLGMRTKTQHTETSDSTLKAAKELIKNRHKIWL